MRPFQYTLPVRLKAWIMAGLGMLLLLLPAAAAAEETNVWDFLHGNVPGTWNVSKGSSATPAEDGLHIHMPADGFLLRPTSFPRAVDGLRLIVTTPRPIDGFLLWHRRGAPVSDLVQLPFSLPVGSPAVLDIDLSAYPQWDARADTAGLAFSSGTDVTVQQIAFVTWSPLQKLSFTWSSFWLMDEFRPTSINFVWGPVIRFSPVTQMGLFGHPPPMGWSVNRIFITILILAALWMLGALLFGDAARARRGIRTFLLIVALLWLGYDLRMGVEFLRYVQADRETYLSPPVGQRMYRTWENLYDAMLWSVPYLQRDAQYGLFSPEGVPTETRMRYFTYPSVPAPSGTGTGTLKTWMVLRHPEVTVDAQGNLMKNGQVLARGGKVLQQFDQTSFLYQVP